jgi:hypothetical protein
MPDRPHLRMSENCVELVPGENHWEIAGYHLFHDEKRINKNALSPGASFSLPEAGEYRAIAVEWSGLESDTSLPLQVAKPISLNVLRQTPIDFSWTRERYLIDGREVPAKEAICAAESVREIVHLHDGVIHREWLQGDRLTEKHDLNPKGDPIRRLHYLEGKLIKREYYGRDGERVNAELFDSEGCLTQSIHGRNHWWYERGVPYRFESSSSRFLKEGERWVKE